MASQLNNLEAEVELLKALNAAYLKHNISRADYKRIRDAITSLNWREE